MTNNPNLGKVLQQKNNPDEPVLPPVAEKDKEVGGIAEDRLRSLVERIEHLEEEKKALGNDIQSVYAEAKAAGFDTKIIRMVIKLRKMNSADRDEQNFILVSYCKALDL